MLLFISVWYSRHEDIMAEKEKERMKTAVILFSMNLNDSGKTDLIK